MDFDGWMCGWMDEMKIEIPWRQIFYKFIPSPIWANFCTKKQIVVRKKVPQSIHEIGSLSLDPIPKSTLDGYSLEVPF